MGPRGQGRIAIAEHAPAAGSYDSPLIAQYMALKAQYPEALVLSRVGDFYEAYASDAEDLARSLDIVLTSKEAGKGGRVAMAGVPHHSVDAYLARLMRQRRVVAIAEQMEQPVPNRLVRREIIRVLTPGTVLEDQFLDPRRNNFLCAIVREPARALAWADVSTGEAAVIACASDDLLHAELDRLEAAEAIVADDDTASFVRATVGEACRIAVIEPEPGLPARSRRADVALDDEPAVEGALALLSSYLTRLKLDGPAIASRARATSRAESMLLDGTTRRHLDLVTASGDNARASLLGVLTKTRTPMGSRLLANRLCAPLLDAQRIRRRLQCVEAMRAAAGMRDALQDILGGIGDIERIVAKAKARRAGPRDLSALRRSLERMTALRAPLESTGTEALTPLRDAACGDPRIGALAVLLAQSLVEEPPPTLTDGGAISPSFHAGLAEVVDLRSRSREHMLQLEAGVRARTGIKSLKIKYTQAFGYHYEVPRAQAASVPDDFVRKQSLVNAERFTDVALKELEAAILSAKGRQVALERELFEGLLARDERDAPALLAAAAAVAKIDVYCGLAQVAAERRYVMPEIADSRVIDVEDGRHPVVEAFGGVGFVPNDCKADDERRFLFITGPNMGGKSTYLRQTALITILAQMGSFVPARRARLGIVDRVFTRIGAGDDIAAGRSTFYVEMAEMAGILRRCTGRSLLLIDEVGRGTGTTDGLAIAQSISEYLLGLDAAMPIVLFATHFHELVGLAKVSPLIENLHVMVADEAAGPVFSHRVLHGASSRSYGIAVAKMAGLPHEVVDRAREIADEIESRPQAHAAPIRRRRVNAESREGNQLDMGIG